MTIAAELRKTVFGTDMMEVLEGKTMLDATCGGRQTWSQKNHPHVLYMDIRVMPHGLFQEKWMKGKTSNFCVEPDWIGDYRATGFPDGWFETAAFWDPPHKQNYTDCITTDKYGALGPNWEEDITRGFLELMRVLAPQAILIVKWAETDITKTELLRHFPIQPLQETRTKKSISRGGTWWFTFARDDMERIDEM